MQKWISEEFALVLRTRDGGVSAFQGEQRIRQQLQLSEFNGRVSEVQISELRLQFLSIKSGGKA